MEENKDILKRIKKLWDKANSAEKIGSIAEAEVFFNKVNELLIQYNLSTIDLNNVKDDQTFIKEEKFETGSKGINWKFDFICKIAELNFCKCLFSLSYVYYWIIGSSTNIKITKEFIDFLIPIVQILYEQEYLKQVIELREKYHVIASSYEEARDKFNIKGNLQHYVELSSIMPSSYKEEMKNKPQKYFIKDLTGVFGLYRNKFIYSFTLGFVNGLSKKIKEERKKQEEGIQQQTTALVIFYEEKIDNFIKTKYKKVNSVSRDINYGNGYYAGYNKGNNFDLSKKLKKIIEEDY